MTIPYERKSTLIEHETTLIESITMFETVLFLVQIHHLLEVLKYQHEHWINN